MTDLTGKPTESLQGRDVRLAKLVNQVLDDPDMIATMSSAEVRENVLFCMKRLLVFRMGGRSTPLVALSSILQHAELASLSFLSNETTAPRSACLVDLRDSGPILAILS